MEINLTGQSKNENMQLLSIAEDSYKAKITEVGDPFMSKGYETEEEQEKLTISFEIDLEGQKAFKIENEKKEQINDAKIVLRLWATTKVSKGSGKYSNSKLYDVVEKMGLLPKFTEEAEGVKTPELLSTWLSTNLVGKSCKVMVKNSAKGVSRVNEVLRPLGE